MAGAGSSTAAGVWTALSVMPIVSRGCEESSLAMTACGSSSVLMAMSAGSPARPAEVAAVLAVARFYRGSSQRMKGGPACPLFMGRFSGSLAQLLSPR